MSYGYLRACTRRDRQTANPDIAQNVINSFLGPGWKDADEAGNTESRDWIHFCANELRKASGLPTED
ncbi:hypothetical protein P7H12_25955 [Paenibacillus larvae]|nr:hypothetical protein [Paenibacillus larvae]MDT2266359.1 hypothetical protein [Paenibacillus larvae]